MATAIVLFTRDLRVHDNPALARAVSGAEAVVPLFVQDRAIEAAYPRRYNRRRFLVESLTDLRTSLRRLGGDLVVRRGDPVAEVVRMARHVGAEQVIVAADVSGYAQRRERRLRRACATHRISLTAMYGVTVVPPGEVRPGAGPQVSHAYQRYQGYQAYQVFTPYWRAWSRHPWRAVAPAPRRVILPAGLDPGPLPDPSTSPGSPGSPGLPGVAGSPRHAQGGETPGRQRLRAWLSSLGGYPDRHDLMAVDGTSRLSPYLRFGCLSPLDVALAARRTGIAAAEDFIRQLCWRDFFHQVTAAFPEITVRPIRAAPEGWRIDPDALAAWEQGRTGVPIVDAGMRQLADEGWMHNRARLLTGSFLTRHLGLDWRDGAAWFADWLLDGDVPDNYGNWQWVAGTGNDPRRGRLFNPIRQARRYDPDGDYVRRYLPELSAVDGRRVHQPWLLPPARRRGLDYPLPLSGSRPANWLPV